MPEILLNHQYIQTELTNLDEAYATKQKSEAVHLKDQSKLGELDKIITMQSLQEKLQ